MDLQFTRERLVIVRVPSAFSIQDQGAGPAVLCLHGFPQNASVFDEFARQLVDKGFRVIRFDQRGYTDDTSGYARRKYTVGNLASDALAVLDHREVSSCIVVGHDLGGMVAWEMSRIAPSRVVSLVIVGAPHPGAFLLSLVSIRQLARSWYFAAAQSTLLATTLYSPAKPSSRKRLAAELAKSGLTWSESQPYLDFMAHDNRFVGAIRWYQAMPFTSLRSAFFRMTRDAHIVVGDADEYAGRLSIELTGMFAWGKRVTVTMVDGGTHWLFDHHPEAIAAVVSAERSRSDR